MIKKFGKGLKSLVPVCVLTLAPLAASAQNIDDEITRKNYYFVPMRQDDIIKKPASLVADFDMLPDVLEAALDGIQLRPMIL